MKSRKQDQEISALLQRIDAMSTERNIAEWMSKSQPNSRNPSEASSSSKSSEMGVDASRLAHNMFISMQRLENYPRCRFTREELYKYFPDGARMCFSHEREESHFYTRFFRSISSNSDDSFVWACDTPGCLRVIRHVGLPFLPKTQGR
jgi:hypothetical protein